MGRIKTKLIKRVTNEVVEEYAEQLTGSFEDNKKVISEHVDTQSKKLRNMIAGYATRRKKQLTAAQ